MAIEPSKKISNECVCNFIKGGNIAYTAPPISLRQRLLNFSKSKADLVFNHQSTLKLTTTI